MTMLHPAERVEILRRRLAALRAGKGNYDRDRREEAIASAEDQIQAVLNGSTKGKSNGG